MTASLSCTTAERDGCLIVVVRGRLDLAGASRLWVTLQKSLAEQPVALLVDLSAMVVGDESSLSVFTAINRQAAVWPWTPVLLCAPAPDAAGPLSRGRFGALPVRADVDQAVREATRAGVVVPVIRDQLLPVAGAARHARDLATEACVRWDLPDLIGPVGMVVTELVDNAVEHAGTMITVQLARRPRYLNVAVRDGSARPPEAADPDNEDEDSRGRGLMLVSSFADHWGWLPTSDGKVVWATLAAG
jgi:anti-sigma regulatory factor (Ser/Thr protein kinase)